MTRTLIVLLCSLALATALPGCKKSDGSSGGSSSSKSSSNSTPSGTYVWVQPEGTMSLTFKGNGVCTMSMTEGGSTEDTPSKYTVNANTVTVHADNPGSFPLTLTVRDDGNLEGSFMGMPAVFVKQ